MQKIPLDGAMTWRLTGARVTRAALEIMFSVNALGRFCNLIEAPYGKLLADTRRDVDKAHQDVQDLGERVFPVAVLDAERRLAGASRELAARTAAKIKAKLAEVLGENEDG